MRDQFLSRDSSAQRVTWVGALANLVLMVLKFAAGVAGHSAAMIADAFHSLSDLGSDAVVLVGLRISSRPVDDTHPYGHGKVETSAAVVVGVILVAAGLGILFEGVKSLSLDEHTNPTLIALVAAIISILVKEILYRITKRIGKRENKPSLLANAWHHRSDALSSVAAFIGIGGSMLGVYHLDQVAAMVVSIFILQAGVTIAWSAYKDLVDTAVESKLLDRIVEVIEDTSGVKGWHKLRTRKVGGAIFVDLHLEVAEDLSIREAHDIADLVEQALTERLPVDDVTVHVEISR